MVAWVHKALFEQGMHEQKEGSLLIQHLSRGLDVAEPNRNTPVQVAVRR
jgi:hypothetical protein